MQKTDEGILLSEDEARDIHEQIKDGGGALATELSDLLEDDQSHEVTMTFGLEMTLSAIDEEVSKAKLQAFLDDTRNSSRLESVLFDALRQIIAESDESIDIAALNLTASDID